MIPSNINSVLGKQTLAETWQAFDPGNDARHRWRTIRKGGTDVYSREITGESFGCDPSCGLALPNFIHRPGTLILEAHKVPEDQRARLWNKKYAGAEINCKLGFSQKYGYFEFTVRIPKGVGPYVAGWLMPAPPPGLSMPWPKGGEIDVFEFVGNPLLAYHTVHASALPMAAGQRQLQKRNPLPFDASGAAHRYGVAYDQDEIVWFIDRKEVFRVPTPAEMTAPMYLLLTLGASHPWDNDRPNASTPWPMQMVCYGINVWELRS